MPTLARDKSVLKCPQCGLVTFDDLPACPRCKESFALVRPLASTSLDGARHVLRDDPELRLKLRERLHRARLDRRKRNENPLALGPDPDAPDWFEPDIGGGNGAAEAATAPASEAAQRSKESTTVPIDDHTADDDVRAGTTTSDSHSDPGIIEASREAEDGDETVQVSGTSGSGHVAVTVVRKGGAKAIIPLLCSAGAGCPGTDPGSGQSIRALSDRPRLHRPALICHHPDFRPLSRAM